RAELYERRLFTIRTGKGLKVATRSFPFSLSTHTGNRLLIDRILYPINFSHGSSVVFHIRQLVCYKRPVSFSKTKKTAHSFRQSSSNERFIFKIFLGKIFNALSTQAFLRVNNQLHILNLHASDGLLSLLVQQLSNSRR